MTNKKECKIIQDLLPNYVDNLTSNETNMFIENHLKECIECSSILQNMNKEFEKENVNVKKEVNYAKKYNIKYKKVKYSLIIIIWSLILIILAFFGRKMIVFNDLYNKINSYQNATNYYMRIYDYNGFYSLTTETWVKDKNMLQKDNNIKTISIKDNTMYQYFVEGEAMISPLTNENFTSEGILKTYYWDLIELLKNELKNPQNVLKYSLKNAIVNGKECYQLMQKGRILYFDKETGLIVRWEELTGYMSPNQNEIQSTLKDFKFEFNNVENKDFL